MPSSSVSRRQRRQSRRRGVVVAAAVLVVGGLGAVGADALTSTPTAAEAPAVTPAPTPTAAPAAAPAAPRAAAAPVGVTPIAGGGGASCPKGTGADLTISSDCTFTADGEYGNVMIMGARVAVADADLTLKFKSLVAMGKGSAFLAGCPTPITHHVNIVMTETDAGANPNSMGPGVIGADNAEFCLKGARVDRRWDRAATTAKAGATSITTQQAMNLQAGDKVLLTASTDQADSEQVVTVTSGSGKTFSFTPALTTPVLGEDITEGGKTLSERTEVARLSGSNITVETADGARSHLMTMGKDGVSQISGVDLRRMGADFKQYCAHFHVMGSQPNSYIEHSACDEPNSRGFVMHGTDDARFEDLVVYKGRGSEYLLGEGCPEKHNLFKHLLGANPRSTKLGADDFDAADQRDHGPSAIWTCASNNTFKDLAAAGVADGWGVRFDFSSFEKNRGLLSTVPGDPRKNPAGAIDQVSAHAVESPHPGHVCDRFMCGTGVFMSVEGDLKNSNPNWDGKYAEKAFGPYQMNRVTAWSNHVGVWATRSANVTNAAIGDNCRAIVAQDARFDNALAIGRTGVGQGCKDQDPEGTEAYDFATWVTNSVFAHFGKRGAFDHWGSFGHDQTNFYGHNFYGNIKLIDVPVPFYHPAIDGNEAKDDCGPPANGFVGWIHNVDGLGDGYIAFPCAPPAGTFLRGSNLKFVPLSERDKPGGPDPVMWNGKNQFGDPFANPALNEPLTPVTVPDDVTDGDGAPGGGSPTASPTDTSTESPTASPTDTSTGSPTASPTDTSTESPTASPTDTSTESPTASPTDGEPAAAPTASPTTEPKHRHRHHHRHRPRTATAP